MVSTDNHSWTENENSILAATYPTSGKKGAQVLLPDRSISAIESHASKLKLPSNALFVRSVDITDKVLKLSETQKAYFAGFFDGEGCIHIAKKEKQPDGEYLEYQLQVDYTNTNKEVMNYIVSFFAGTLIKRNGVNFNQRPYWHWKIYSRSAKIFLKTILPYLIVKRAEANKAIEFQDLMESRHGRLSEDILQQRKILAKEISLLKGRINH